MFPARKLLLLMLFLVPAPSSARQFDVAGYVKTAISSSYEVKTQQESYEIQKREYLSSLAGMYLPHIYYTLSDTPYSETRNPFSMREPDFGSDLSVTYNLFSNFSDGRALKVSWINKSQAEKALWLKKQETALDAIKKYCGALKAKRLLEVVKASEESYADEYQKAKEYYREGLKSYSDLLKSDLNLKTAQLSTISSENYYKNVLMDLNSALYADPQEENSLEELSFDTGFEIEPVEKAVVRAFKDRTEIRLYGDNIRIKELERREKLWGYFPQFSADLSYSRSELFGLGEVSGRKDHYSLKLSMTVPLGTDLFGKNKDYAASSTYLEREKRALEELKLSIKKEIIAVSLDFFYSKKKYEVSKVKADISKDNLEIIKQKYSEGKADILGLVDAQKDYLSSESDLAESYYDLYIKAAEYEKAVGKQLWEEEKK